MQEGPEAEVMPQGRETGEGYFENPPLGKGGPFDDPEP